MLGDTKTCSRPINLHAEEFSSTATISWYSVIRETLIKSSSAHPAMLSTETLNLGVSRHEKADRVADDGQHAEKILID